MLDTSTVILLGRLADPAVLPDESVISAVTLAELSVGPHVASTTKERAARQAHLQQAESDFDAIAFDAQAARTFGRCAASLRSAGRKPAARAYDALIAASAIAENVPLYTCNPDDFAGIDGLDVRPVPHPDSHPVGSTASYTQRMSKVMVSLPDDLLAQLDAEVKRRSTSRSALLASAARRELARRDPAELTAAIERSERRFRGAGSFESAELVQSDRDDRR
jgi:predicted nucleic acid-binding protein